MNIFEEIQFYNAQRNVKKSCFGMNKQIGAKEKYIQTHNLFHKKTHTENI